MTGETAIRTIFGRAHTLGASREAYCKHHAPSLATGRERQMTTGGRAELPRFCSNLAISGYLFRVRRRLVKFFEIKQGRSF